MSKFHTNEVMHIKEITLLIQNMKRSLEFYCDILGFSILNQQQHEVSLTANGKESIITLIEDRASIPQEITLGLYHVAFLLPNRQALASIVKQLNTKRYPLTGASDHGVSEAIYLDDPDGNGIEIYVDKPKTEWPLEKGKITMYTKHLDLDDLMMHLPKTPYTLINEQTIIGHLHFHVRNLEEAKQFYCGVLGFEIVMYYMKSALFISSFEYHHHIGLNTWVGDAPLSKVKQVGLKSYVLSVPKDQYPLLLRNLTKYGIPLILDGNKKFILDPLNQKIIFEVAL
ncbi:MAG: VOC family protein [Tenericutes bacterium]|nr:VOC family protein [Mycoplasmatota bacterium]